MTVAMWYLQRYDLDCALQLVRHAIQHFNLANGVMQTPTRGYHETITVCYMRLVAHFKATLHADCTELERTNALLASPLAQRQYLLNHYTRARLMGWEARSGWVEPDVCALPGLQKPILPIAPTSASRVPEMLNG